MNQQQESIHIDNISIFKCIQTFELHAPSGRKDGFDKRFTSGPHMWWKLRMWYPEQYANKCRVVGDEMGNQGSS